MTFALTAQRDGSIGIEYGGRELTISVQLLSMVDEEMARLNKSQPDSAVLIAVATRLEHDGADHDLRLELVAYARCALRMRRSDIPGEALRLLNSMQNEILRKLCVEYNRSVPLQPTARW